MKTSEKIKKWLKIIGYILLALITGKIIYEVYKLIKGNGGGFKELKEKIINAVNENTEKIKEIDKNTESVIDSHNKIKKEKEKRDKKAKEFFKDI